MIKIGNTSTRARPDRVGRKQGFESKLSSFTTSFALAKTHDPTAPTTCCPSVPQPRAGDWEIEMFCFSTIGVCLHLDDLPHPLQTGP